MSKFIMSSVVASFIPQTIHKAILEAVGASLGSRKVTTTESTGMKNAKKTQLATSGELTEYEQQVSVVTAFIQWSEAEVGTVDKFMAKAAKLGFEAKLASIPATVSNQDVAGWIAKFAKSEAKPTEAAPVTRKSKKGAKPAAPVTEAAPAAPITETAKA